MTKLSAQLRDAADGDHLCLVYESAEEQARVIAPFIGGGLAADHACVYVADDNSPDAIRSILWSADIDVAAEERNGRLRILPGRETYLGDGEFDPQGMIASLRKIEAEMLAQGRPHVRLMGEMTWALAGTDPTRLVEYEALLNRFYPGSNCTGICQYHRRKFPAEIIAEVLRTHPVAVLGDDVCSNLYYEPPDFFLNGRSPEAVVDWMISQLHRQRAVEDQERSLREAAESASRAKTNFLAMMSHELRTPLNAIIGYEQLLSDGLSGPVTPTQQGQLGRIRASALHLLTLIDEILTLSRIETGHDEIRDELVRVAGLVDEVAGVIHPLAKAKQLATEMPAVDQAAVIRSDQRKLRQVLLNLLTNAVKFTDRGSVTLDFALDEESAVFRVRDTGIGIAPEDRTRIFEPFWQAAAITTRTNGGTGLGLSLSRQLAKQLGGVIEVDSEPGQGSEFTLRIPRGPTIH